MTLPPLDYETPKESKGDGLGVVAVLLLLIGAGTLFSIGRGVLAEYVSGARAVLSWLGIYVSTRPRWPLFESGVTAALALVMMVGAVQMLSRQRYWVAMVGAVVALVPISNSCFFITIPLGIWALVVLRRPEVRETFRR